MNLRHIFLFCTLLSVAAGWSQSSPTIAPQVLNSAGNHYPIGSTGMTLSDNVGEPFTQTQSVGIFTMLITEGFLQPEIVSPAGFTLNPAMVQHQNCMEINDGMITLSLTSTYVNYNVNYIWKGTDRCPGNNCSKVDSLKPGNYSVSVAIQYTDNIGQVKKDTISSNFTINAAGTPCIVKVFHGISPNNDNTNEYLTIENISGFPKNHVMIFNRWGNLLFETNGYDQNVQGKRWPEQDELSKLSSSTYFYIIELEPGGKPLKGWVELIKE